MAENKKPAAPELETEVASRLRDPYEQTYLGVLQTNDPLLLEKGDPNGEIYRDLKRDGKVFASIQKRKHALIGEEFQVVPVDEGDAQSKDAAPMSCCSTAGDCMGAYGHGLPTTLPPTSPSIAWTYLATVPVPIPRTTPLMR